MANNNINHGRKEVPLHTMPWFHGKMSREDSENLLTPPSVKEDGLYLVRESQHYPGDYTLSVYHNPKVEHYRIVHAGTKLTIDQESSFDNLHQLVEHYQADSDGLVCKLKKPLTKTSGSFETVINQSDFVEGGWQIPKTDLDIQELIGKGEFSEVHKAVYRGQMVAVKIINLHGNTLQAFLAEARLMTSLRHPNLVQLLGVVMEDKLLYIVTEFMSKGSLVDYLRTRGRAVITPDDQLRFANWSTFDENYPNQSYRMLETASINNAQQEKHIKEEAEGCFCSPADSCSGMAHLESKNVVHRDLAARNVLVHETGHAKVSDFGLALPTESQHTGGKIPIKWTAPEALKNNQHFTSKSDVWSFGILLWEIYSFGRVPYPKIPLADVTSYIESGSRMEQPDGCPQEVYNIMKLTWNMDPAKRPTFAQIREKFAMLCSTPV